VKKVAVTPLDVDEISEVVVAAIDGVSEDKKEVVVDDEISGDLKVCFFLIF
jgi:hypothetical protein